MASSNVVGLIGAGVGIAAGIAVGMALSGKGPEDTNIVLSAAAASDQPCSVSSKENVIFKQKGKQVTWVIRDHDCKRTGSEDAVIIGNFQRNSASTAGDCSKAHEGDAETNWPFTDDPADDRVRRPTGKKIKLTLKAGLATGAEFYFDICTIGPSSQKKADPRLVIDP